MKEHPNYSGKTYKMINMIYKVTIDFSADISGSSLVTGFVRSGESAIEFYYFYTFYYFFISYGLDVSSGYYCGSVANAVLKAGHTPGGVVTGGSAGNSIY